MKAGRKKIWRTDLNRWEENRGWYFKYSVWQNGKVKTGYSLFRKRTKPTK